MSKSITALIDWQVICHSEETPVEGNALASGDDAEDTKAEQYIRDQLESGNDWAWCTVEIQGDYLGLSASQHLGCCSYKNRLDFEESGYFRDMKLEVAQEIQEQYERIKND